MPLPLFFIGVAAATGTFGAVKTVKAGVDQKKADDINKKANHIVKSASNKIELCRKNCGSAIDNLGSCKINILDNSIKPFISEFEKLNHVEFEESEGLNELQKMVLDKKKFTELKRIQSIATSIAGGLASGAMAGAITAFGAYGAAGVLATASTGTAIASLSGAAATNATLAFFGGGSLAAGGLGMAGGSAVLGGLVAGPALAVLGLVVGANAEANKNRAYSNLAKAREFEEEIKLASVMCIAIRKRANMFKRFLLTMNSAFEPLIYQMEEIIRKGGTDFREYTKDERNIVAEAMTIAGAIKAVLDTPILDDNGNLNPKSEKIVETTKEKYGVHDDLDLEFSSENQHDECDDDDLVSNNKLVIVCSKKEYGEYLLSIINSSREENLEIFLMDDKEYLSDEDTQSNNNCKVLFIGHCKSGKKVRGTNEFNYYKYKMRYGIYNTHAFAYVSCDHVSRDSYEKALKIFEEYKDVFESKCSFSLEKIEYSNEKRREQLYKVLILKWYMDEFDSFMKS